MLQFLTVFLFQAYIPFKAEIDIFRRFADKVEKINEENNKVAMDLDDAPDEFRGRFILNSNFVSKYQETSAL